MSIKLPSDSAVRAAAIDPARSFIIQAPAGSGKTELLTDRILALLATVNRPEEIVAITFTRKAASEMHARVLSKLAAGLGSCPPEAYKKRSWQLAQKAMQRNDELGWNLLQYPARLGIRTIDSFSTYLVRAMPWLSALGGLPAIADNASEHYEAAARATLAMADDNDSVARFISHLDVNRQSALGLLASMLASRDHWLPLLAPGSDIDQLLENLDKAVETDLENLAESMPPGWSSTLAPLVSRAASVLADKGVSTDWAILEPWQGEAFDTDMSGLAQWQALAGMLLTKDNKPRKTVTISQGFEPKSDYKDDFVAWLKGISGDEPWVAALADVRSAPSEGYTDEQQDILRVLIEVLWLAAAQLNVCFSEAAEVDFTEISRRALDALGRADDPSDLLLVLDTAIRHLLVDEFQDTSLSQIQLLERLTSGWMPDDGRTLFLVGDPMQSIYRFRKAEVGLFLTVKEHGLGEVKLTALELKDNFRSQANLVEWVNKTCRPIFPKEDHPGLGAIRYTDAVAFNEGVEGVGVEFHPVWTVKDDKQADEAGALAATAESIAIQLAKEALLRNPDSEHPVAILVRARTHLDGIVHRLAQQNIPCRAVELVSLQSRQVVIDLAQLARALSHPADRLAWLSVLRSPLCGLTLDSLHALCGSDLRSSIPLLLAQWLGQDAKGMVHLPDTEAKRLRHAAAVLLDGSNASGAIPFAAWLESCWQRLGGPAVYRSASDAADAERLFRLVEDLAPYGKLNPVELDDKLAKLYAAPNSSGRAVEVMTIHKSKGLEFETVILAGLHRRAKGDTSPLLRFEHSGGELLLGPIKHRTSDEHDPVSVYLAEREKKRAAYEADRLLYVALTRARQQLHLIGVLELTDPFTIKKPEASSLLARLWDQMPPPQIPDMADLIVEHPGRSSGTGSQARLLVRMTEQSLPTVLAPYKGVRQAGAWAWRPDAGHESMTGTVAHAWLERIGKEGVDAWSIERVDSSMPVFRKQLSRAGLAGAAVDAAAQVLRDTLAATLVSPKGQWLLRAARAHREWSLLDVSGRVSVIDLAIFQEQDWLVVDYKTGVPHDGEPHAVFAERMRARYSEQIGRYCAHVSALDGRPARGALYFPRADVWVDY
ncbi:UvrD-helicase domain-containing protein [Alcaligenaceae bacterium]|nr:UvrD-helicase domain-containing protein [Alcaligenaceae bacterium]